MAQQRQVHVFSGGMDFDSAKEYVAEGDYTFMQNARSFVKREGANGLVVPVPGTVEVEDIYVANRSEGIYELGSLPEGTNPEGTNTVIGAYTHRSRNWVFIFRHNDAGRHSIFRYDLEQNAEYEVYVTDPANGYDLNFQLNKPNGERNFITGIAAVDANTENGTETFLFWVDDVNMPSMVNVDQITFLHPSIDRYNKYFFSLLKAPPLRSLTTQVNLTPGIPAGSDRPTVLNNKVYQFSYRYVYKNGMKSVYSPITEAIMVDVEPGFRFDNITLGFQDMFLDFNGGGIAGEQYRALIDYVEIVFREGINEPWRFLDRVNPDLGSFAGNVIFEGRGSYPVVSREEVEKLFDTVPLRAKALTTIDNRVFIANYEEDFGDFELDATLSHSQSINNFINNNKLAFKNNTPYSIGVEFRDEFGRKSLVFGNDNLKIVTPKEFDPSVPNINKYTLSLNGQPPEWAHSYQIVRTRTDKVANFLMGILNDVKYVKEYDSNGEPKLWRKKIGVAGLNNESNVFDNLRETGTPTVSGEREFISYVSTSITNSSWNNADNKFTDPIYEGGVNTPDPDSSIEIFEQKKIDYPTFSKTSDPVGMVGGVFDVANSQPNGTYTKIFKGGKVGSVNGPPASKYFWEDYLKNSVAILLDISNWSGVTRDEDDDIQPDNQIYYNFQEGDKVNIYPDPADPDTHLYGVPVVGFENGLLEIPIVERLIDGTIVLGKGTLIEVYQESEAFKENVYYNVGLEYPITNPETPSRAYSNTSIEVQFGDVSFIRKQMYADQFATPENFYIFSMNPFREQTYETWERGDGKVNAMPETKQFESSKSTSIRFSNQIIDGTKVNQINTFNALDEKTFPYEYGEINKLEPLQAANVEARGNILLSIHEKETVSIYINKTTLQDFNQNDAISLSDAVLGSFNTLSGSYGTTNPESVAKYDSNIYFYDSHKGKVLRYGRNGLIPISNYNMKSYFENVRKQAQGQSYFAIGGIDYYHDEYVLRFANIEGLGKECLGFNEPANKWSSFYTFDPEYMAYIDARFLMFKNGRTYYLDEEINNNAATFFGEEEQVKVGIATNQPPLMRKTFQSEWILGRHKWYGERITTTKGETSFPLESVKADLEGEFAASIPRNINTPNAGNAIANGAPMKGRWMESILVLDESIRTYTDLSEIIVIFTDSQKT